MRALRRHMRSSWEGLPDIGVKASVASVRRSASSLGIMERQLRARQLVDALTRWWHAWCVQDVSTLTLTAAAVSSACGNGGERAWTAATV